MRVEPAVRECCSSTLPGMVVRCGAYPAKGEKYCIRLCLNELYGLYDKIRVILYDKGACEFVTSFKQRLCDKIKVLVTASAVEDLGTDNEGEESGSQGNPLYI